MPSYEHQRSYHHSQHHQLRDSFFGKRCGQRNIDLHNRHWLLIYARLLSICRDVGHRQPHPSAPPI